MPLVPDQRRDVPALTPWAVVGVLIGYMLGMNLHDQVVGYLLGAFALLMAAKGLHEIFYKLDDIPVIYQKDCPDEHARQQTDPGSEAKDELSGVLDDDQAVADEANDIIKNGLLGLPMGLVSGILGISGGVIEVPLQRYFAGISLRNAIANSSVMVFWASLSAAIVSLYYGRYTGAIADWTTPFGLALIMIPSSYLGGMLGARLLKHVSIEILNWSYVGLMLLIGTKMLIGQ